MTQPFFNLLYVVCIEVYLLIWMIRYGLLLKTLVIHSKTCMINIILIVIFVLFRIFILCIAGRMRSYGMNMVLVGLQKMS